MKWVIPNGFVINWINVILTEIVLTNAWDVIVTGKYRNGWISWMFSVATEEIYGMTVSTMNECIPEHSLVKQATKEIQANTQKSS